MELSNVLYYSLYENSIYIYVIRQECGKYFIGKTDGPRIAVADIQELAKKNNQRWLLNYRPYEIQELIHSLDTWDEDKITLKYMDKYGIDNVRGGSFNSVSLSSEELNTIRAMIASAKVQCPICNSHGHTKSNCPMLSEFRDYEVVIKDQTEFITTTHNANTVAIGTVKYISNAISSAAQTTNTLWQSWFGSGNIISTPKCIRCGYGGHKTGQCINEIKISEDSLMFPDNKKYNPLFKGHH